MDRVIMSKRADMEHEEGLPSLDCWDYSIELECLRGPEDLQLAAELGKTLLERNKELETSLRQHQNVIEDQTQEIEYLTKQTAALREVNDSRLRIYEQLEVSIQDLERANQRLTVDNSADKKHIKSLCAQIDSLESRCEELQKSVDEMTVAQETVRRRQRRSVCTPDEPVAPKFEMITQNTLPPSCESSCDEEVTQLLQQLQESKTQRSKEQRRIQDLEEQTQLLIQENTCLEEQLIMLTQKEEDMKSLQEELTTLEEIRQGHLCRRCLRETDERSLTAEDDDDDISVIDSLVNESHRNSVLMQLQDGGNLWTYIWMLLTRPKLVFILLGIFCLNVKNKYILPCLMLPFTIPFLLAKDLAYRLKIRILQ
uniref:HAP1 N-terminal domain-containing protein n=1 Tax=Clastoptera arizonana TaxID=38151 RepID=A0A1B6CRN1_9HEMI